MAKLGRNTRPSSSAPACTWTSLARLRDAEQAIGLRGDLADARADREQEVGLLDARHQ
jgi:hypothetical protein